MPFNSPLFLFIFAPAFFVIFYVAPVGSRNIVCLLLSFFFYAWAEPLFIFVIIASGVIDYWVVRSLPATSVGQGRKALAALGVIQSLSILLYFKYSAFLYSAICGLIGADLKPPAFLSPLLPLAISFVTFEKITYVVDNYRGVGRPARSLLDYLTYVFLFPKLIAGPIVKYHDIEPYLKDHRVRVEDFRYGVLRFAIGLAKKALIADNLAATVDTAFTTPPDVLSSGNAWLGVLCFSFQIYFDFSGYSDMAIGLCRMMGFPLRENFNQPYLAENFTEFWHRWHISLSTWIRDYLYIPLGGNRVPQWRVYLNLVICFVLSGLWHGANWTFLLWGLYHGVFLIADRIGLRRVTGPLPSAVNVAATFLLVTVGWVLFRSPDIHHAAGYFNAMTDLQRAAPPVIFLDQNITLTLGAACVMSFVPQSWFYPRSEVSRAASMYEAAFAMLIAFCFVWAGSRLMAATFTPFLYFRF